MAATLNLSDIEADVLMEEIPGVIEDNQEVGDEERAEVLERIFSKLYTASSN